MASLAAPNLFRSDQTFANARIDNLQQIGQAMEKYYKANGHFPPACTLDGNGKPEHSWRALLLPYLVDYPFRGKYDFTVPWNSPQNTQLAMLPPNCFVGPGDKNAMTGDTSYVVIQGSNLVFDKDTQRKINEIADGPQQTLLVVEAYGCGINWLDPRDPQDTAIDWTVNTPTSQLGARLGDGTIFVLTADGKVHRITDRIPSDQLRGMATINGGETVPMQAYRP